MNNVDGVVRAQRLGQHILDTGALEHRTHRATRNNTGTRSGWTQQDNACCSLTLDRVRNGALDTRDLEELLLGLLDTLDVRVLLRRVVAATVVAVTAAAASVIALAAACTAGGTGAGAGSSTLGSRHQTFLFSEISDNSCITGTDRPRVHPQR